MNPAFLWRRRLHWNGEAALEPALFCCGWRRIAFEALPPHDETGDPKPIEGLGWCSNIRQCCVFCNANRLSPALISPDYVWNDHRRALGPESVVSALQEDRPLQLLAHTSTAQYSGPRWFTSERFSHVLGNAGVSSCGKVYSLNVLYPHMGHHPNTRRLALGGT